MTGALITINYTTIDGVDKYEDFETLETAQARAQYWMGKHPEIGAWYAVSFDGIARLHCSGCSLTDLFPET